MSRIKNEVQENPLYKYFTVTYDPSYIFNAGAIFSCLEILGCHSDLRSVIKDDDLPEGIEMLYKEYGKTVYRCKFTDGELKVIGRC